MSVLPLRKFDGDDEFEGLLPPNAVDAEVDLLGGILFDPNALDRVVEILEPRHFYVSSHQQIYEACLALKSENKPVDMLFVSQWLRDSGLLEKVGGNAAIASLLDGRVGTANIDAYAHLIAEKWKRRRLAEIGRHITRLAHEQMKPWQEIYDESEQMLLGVNASQRLDMVSLADVEHEVYSQVDMRSAQMKLPGIATDYYDLDEMTQGFQRSDLIVIAGRPSMGKTAWALSLARGMAEKGEGAIAIFSLEMSANQLGHRLTSMEGGIDSASLKSGRLNPNQWVQLQSVCEALSDLPIFIDETPGIEIAEVCTKARKLKAKEGQLAGIFIDYLQLMGGIGDDANRAIGKITSSLKNLAKELDCPIFALSQLSRGVENRTNKRPRMSDLRESGNIEQDSDLIMMLYREEYYDPETADKGIVEVILAKHRNGPTGTVKALFQPEISLFRNIARI